MNEVVAGFIGVGIGAVSSFFLLRYNYKKLYAETVSSNRMEWIKQFREEIAIIVATLNMCDEVNNLGVKFKIGEVKCDKPEFEYFMNMIYNAEKARATLITRLNQDITKKGNEYNQVLLNELNDIDFFRYKDYKKKREKIARITRKILQPEWGRVKDEARGVTK